MTPQEMLSAMEVGGGLAARAQQFDLQKQKLALDSAQVNLQMAHEQAKFPLQIQGLQMQNEANSRALILQKKAMDLQSEDEQAMTNWQLENMDNPYAVLTNPPQVKTLGMLKQVAEMQAVIGRTAKGIQMTKQAIGTDPAVQALVEERRAQAEAAKARADLYRAQSLGTGKEGELVVRKDVVPGLTAIWMKGSRQVHYERNDGKPMTKSDQALLLSRLASIKSSMNMLDANDPDRQFFEDQIKALTSKTQLPEGPASVAPKTETPPDPKDPLGLFK